MKASLFRIVQNIGLTAFCLIISASQASAERAGENAIDSADNNRQDGLYAKATILGAGRYWTIVPKNAIIHLPGNLANRILPSPKGKYLAFHAFLTRNSSWLHAYPVSLDYARGNKRMDKHRFDSLLRINKIVVITYRKNPISLHSNAHPLEDDTPSNQ